MSPNQEYRSWKYLNISLKDKKSGEIIGYRIHFYKRIDDWYDEIRYDSHEIKRGRQTLSPHFHMKLSTPFKDRERGEREIREIIDEILPRLKEVIG